MLSRQIAYIELVELLFGTREIKEGKCISLVKKRDRFCRKLALLEYFCRLVWS